MAGIADMNDVLELSGYIQSMVARMKNLARVSEEIALSIEKFDSEINSKRSDLKKELSILKAEAAGLKEEVHGVQKVIVELITNLKNSVKADELERFKKRMDIWAPESLVTRHEVNKVLDER
jgi:predicted  nucleic acid-binding Zn-ribbon protein